MIIRKSKLKSIKLKINKLISFPDKLNMKAFTQENLNDKEYKNEDYYDYQLKGVIIHKGSAEYGHYYSFIKSEGNWFEFNDQTVSKVNYTKIKQKGFGSDDNKDGMKAESAYLLLYERKTYYHFATTKSEEKGVVIPGDIEFNSNIKKEILRQEYFDYVERTMGHDSLYNFILNLEGYSSDHLLNFKLAIKYYLFFVIRQKNKTKLPDIQRLLYNNLKNNIESSLYLIRNFCNLEVIFEFLVDCPIKDMSLLVVALIKSAILRIKESWDSITETDREDMRKFIFKIVNTLILVNNSIGNELNLLYILEALTKELIFCRILRNSNFERLLEYNFLGNIKLHIALGEEPDSEFIYKDHGKNKSNGNVIDRSVDQEYFRTVILRCGIFYFLNIKRKGYPSSKVLNVHFWLLIINFVKSNYTSVMLSKFFIKFTKRKGKLIDEVLKNLVIKEFNFKTALFLLKEIAMRNHRKFNKIIFEKMRLLLSDPLLNNYIAFDLFVKFVIEIAINSEDFFNLLVEKQSFLQALIKKNQYMTKVSTMKEEGVR